ncbi:sensor histidine kinase [Leptospira sp. GIMC2001]|uniref:sensor histidine kinase n=1 Tax=Leptospira sp. GIMC2001 TaxID=1513297 RepID=UPI00234A9755|nr:response regulator [Leptospira sp. GIMC2001]WCL49751.1 response regulator [Leptospira sp. GIMC2001]
MIIEPVKKILLVEDDAIIAISEKRILERNGFNLSHALSGEACLDLLSKDSNFDLILMDIDLGTGLDGTDTAKKLLEKFDIPIIFLSNHTEPDIVKKTESITSYGYIVKNTGETVLIASIKMAFRLKKSNEHFRLTFENSKDAILLADDNGNYVNMNAAAIRMFEIKEKDISKVKITDLNIIESNKNVHEMYQDYIDKGSDTGTIKFRLSNGEIRIAEYNAFQIAPNLHQSILRDITFQRKAEKELQKTLQEKTTLMQELQHRIRNSFAMIIGFINLEKEKVGTKDTVQSLDDLEGRIRSLMKLYDLLLKSDNNSDISLKYYTEYLLESYDKSFTLNRATISIELDLDDIVVSSREATSWGLILNELITNSIKYAFPHNYIGLLKISLKKTNGKLKLEFSDNGIGPNPSFDIKNSETFGLGINIIKMLAEQLNASFIYERNDWTTFKIVVQ